MALPTLIQEGYEVLRELITLYAKQTNLFESTLLLLENNHAEEAYVLFRSQLNNHMLIEYLRNNKEDNKRLKDFMIQPAKSDYRFLKKIKEGINKGWIESERYKDIDERISDLAEILKANNAVTKKVRLILIR